MGLATLTSRSRQRRRSVGLTCAELGLLVPLSVVAMFALPKDAAHAVIDAIPQLAWVARPDGYVSWYNRRWHEYTGTTVEEMQGWGWQSVHDPEVLPRVLERYRASIASGEPFEMEFPIRAADGSFRMFLTRAVPVRAADGAISYWVGTNTDVSEQKQLESALRTSETQLRRAQEELRQHTAQLESAVADRTAQLQDVIKELGTFAYSVAHDLRAPLRTIKGFADLLATDYGAQLNDEARSYLDRITRASQRMDALITDVLEYSRASRAELIIDDIDVADVVREVVETLPSVRTTGGTVRLLDPFHSVRGSRAALLQCFSNLIGNALKFVKPGVKPEVTIRTEAMDGRVRIWVEDNGIGIDPKYHEKIWGMLERVEARYEGTGVGLSIVRRAVERMGGRVGVVSRLNEGSSFWMELPPAQGGKSNSS